MPDNRNFIIAIVLSIAVLIGWQYFVAAPRIEAQKAEQAAQQSIQSTATNAAPSPSPSASDPDAALPPVTASPRPPASDVETGGQERGRSREAAISATPRIPIATGKLSGSLNLRGGRIDDLHLTQFRETVEPDSATITLLSPTGGPDGYFAEFGWIGTEAGASLPGPDTIWTAPSGARLTDKSPVELTFDNGAGLLFTRTIAVDENYMFTVTDKVTNSSGTATSLIPYGRVTRLGEPNAQGWYILHEGLIGVIGEEGLQEVAYSKLEDEKEIRVPAAQTGWLGITDKYWAATIIPEQGRDFEARFARFDQPTLFHQADFRGAPLAVAAGASAETTNRLFAGAKQVSVVDGYQDSLGIDRFELLIDWGWFYFITKPLFLVIDWFFHLFGNFGIAILAVTVLIKLLFFPLANKSYKAMSMMKKVQPQMMEIRDRYKDDRVKQQQALMELYKTEKINPVAGCWPMMVQIPVFFALYKVLFVTIEMRHAPFFGWIRDLAAPDPTSLFNLFGLLPYDVPSFLMIGVWPLIMGLTMFVQMKLNPAPTDPTQQMIFNWMPLIFTFMLATFPAGLVIYWAWNNFLSIVQQYVIMRRQGVKVELWDNISGMFRRKAKPTEGQTGS